MNEQGQPIELATVNRWVTDDKYVKADVLKYFSDNFHMDSNLFIERRVVEFVENVFKGHKETVYELLDEREKLIKDYVNKNFNEPFEDRDFELLSERKIDLIS